MSSPSTRGFINWRGYGTQLKEADYGDGISVQDSTWNMDPNNTNEEVNAFIDREEVTGLEEASDTQLLSISAGHAHAQRATPHALAFFGMAAWGEITTTSVFSIAAGEVYRHDIVLTNTAAVLPSFGWVENRGGLIKAFHGGVAGRYAINFERSANIRLEADVLGSGSFVSVATVRPALLSAEPFLRTSEAHVWLGTGTIGNSSLAQSNTVSDISGSPTSLTCDLVSLNYELVNNLQGDADSYGFGTGLSRCKLERDARQQSLSFSIEHDGTNQEIQRMLDQANLAMEVDVVTGVEIVAGSGIFYGFNLAFPRLRFMAAPIGGGRSKQITEITAEPLQQGDSSSELKAAMLTVFNATSGYLG